MPALANIVRVLSSTTSTGTLTLGSAVQGFLTPSQASMVNGATYTYTIEADYTAVGDDSVPTSREVGYGTYTASGNTLTRNVVNSTNSNALLNLTGDEQVIIAGLTISNRELLIGSKNFYVRTDGSDSNSGLANTSAGAFLTIQKAIDSLLTLDPGGWDVVINVADGTYNEAPNFHYHTGQAYSVTLHGNTTTPSNVVISGGIYAAGGAKLVIEGFKITSSSFGLFVDGPSTAVTLGKMEWGACTNSHIACSGLGYVLLTANYTISGGAGAHLYADNEGFIYHSGVITATLTGTPAFSGAFVQAVYNGYIFGIATYSGSATGPRFDVQFGGQVAPGVFSLTAYPGSLPGTMNGGFYNGNSDFTTTPNTIKTGTSYSMISQDSALIINGSATYTLTLLSASGFPGHWLFIKNISAFAVNSASSNVVPFGSTTAGTSIFPASGANQWATLQSDGTNWVVIGSDTEAARTKLTSGQVSAAATLDIVLTAYTRYRAITVEFDYLQPVTSGADLLMRVSTDGGSTFLSGASDYWHGSIMASLGGGGFAQGSASASAFLTQASCANPGDGNGGVVGSITIFKPTKSWWLAAKWHVTAYKPGGDWRSTVGGGIMFGTTQDTDAIRFLFSSGNISVGDYTVYGEL